MLIRSWLNTLDVEEFMQLQINFSSRTTSLDFQKALEDNIDKRIGRVYGPPSNKILKVFLDDLNMPTVRKDGIVLLLVGHSIKLTHTLRLSCTWRANILFQNLLDLARLGGHLWNSTAHSAAEVCDGKNVFVRTRQRPRENFFKGRSLPRSYESARKWPQFSRPAGCRSVLLL